MKKHLGTISALMCALLLAVPAISTASVNNDQVTSIKLKEADNNGSQDTNSGSGVKTGHIQNNAVTTDKILDGAVGNLDLANGAVTDAKIFGTIGVGKLPVGTASETVAAGDHDHDGLYLKKYGKVAIVAQSGGDYTSPVTAMSNVSSWCGTPSSSNPCLLKIMPGIFDIGSESVVMVSFVDLEGSGENITTIMGSSSAVQKTVVCASNSELRDITVESVGTGFYSGSIAIFIENANSVSISRVTAVASHTGGNGATPIYANYGVTLRMRNVVCKALGGNSNVGFYSGGDDNSVVLEDVTVDAENGSSNWGMFINGAAYLKNVKATAMNSYTSGNSKGIVLYISSDVIMDGVDVTSDGDGIYSDAGQGTAKINNSRVTGADNSVDIGSFASVYCGSSQLVGSISKGTYASIKCFSVYDGNYDAVTCP